MFAAAVHNTKNGNHPASGARKSTSRTFWYMAPMSLRLMRNWLRGCGVNKVTVVAEPFERWLFDRLELPHVEIGAGNGVLSYAKLRFQGQPRSVGRDIRFDLLPVVKHAPRGDLLAPCYGK